ncbi:MAG TPA: ABC transporter permease [Ktedonobacterales bacterium]|nr:ABC transporter permease [Ktedonobacterales bacterium]
MTSLPTTTSLNAQENLRSALLVRTHPRRPNALSATLTFAWRATLKLIRIPEHLADVIAIPIIFTLLFTYLFGGALAGSTGEYLQFLLPGTLAMTVLLVTINAGMGLNTDVTSGVFDRFRTTPIWRPAPIVGALLGDIGRYLLASTLVIALGLVLGFRPAGGVVGVLLAVALVLLFALSLSWIWTTLALVARSPSAIMSISTTVLFPLTLASNVFVQPQTMPGWLQALININPVTHLVTAVRGLMAGTAPTGEVTWVLLGCVILTIIFAPLTMYLYRNKQ